MTAFKLQASTSPKQTRRSTEGKEFWKIIGKSDADLGK